MRCRSVRWAHENNDLDRLARMQREIAERQLTIVLYLRFDTVGLHGFILHERYERHYTPSAATLRERSWSASTSEQKSDLAAAIQREIALTRIAQRQPGKTMQRLEKPCIAMFIVGAKHVRAFLRQPLLVTRHSPALSGVEGSLVTRLP